MSELNAPVRVEESSETAPHRTFQNDWQTKGMCGVNLIEGTQFLYSIHRTSSDYK